MQSQSIDLALKTIGESIKPPSDGIELVYFLLIFSRSAWSSSGLDMLYIRDSISFREILTAC